uniref:Uncharacterized protein n=1 Tax=Amphimedon queenslandica TaxID=400682 RepID=A0A1X7TCD8_AMPQE
MRRGAEQEKMEHQKLESLGHYCTYAVSGKTGELLWKHEPGDFEVHPAYDIGLSSFTHFKLLFHKYLLHEGEVSWHQYSSAIRQIMPHSWTDDFDTKLELAQFNKDKKKSDEPGVTDHISKVSGLAMDHIAGYAFGGLRPHSPTEHVLNPNVLVIHTMKGIEVLHLSSGRPLFSLPLSSTHAAHGDINSDGVIEHINAVINPGEEGAIDLIPLKHRYD